MSVQPIGRKTKPCERLRDMARHFDTMSDCCDLFAGILESGDIKGARRLLDALREEIALREGADGTRPVPGSAGEQR